MEVWERIPYESISVIAAHPDDEVLGCGGTILKALDEGKKVSIIFMTDGSASSPLKDKYKTAMERINEVRKLYKELGVNRILFLGFPDGKLKKNKVKASMMLKEVLKIIDPELILTHYPDWHADHESTYEIVNCVNEELKKDILYFRVYSPKFFEKIKVAVDIEKYYKKKIELLKFYRSQFIYIIPHLIGNIVDDLVFKWYFNKKVEVFL